jgi:hypothetical protein
MSEKKKKVYVVALVERYETLVLASSRQAAIDAVDHHGGADPVWHKVTAQPAKDQDPERAGIEGD